VAKLERVKADSLRSQVYIQLKKRLMEGVWKIGEKLPSENELCGVFGVSRVTVRAALQQLEILGLVETKHGGGTFVKDFSTISAEENYREGCNRLSRSENNSKRHRLFGRNVRRYARLYR